MGIFEDVLSGISRALGGNWKAPSETNRNVQQRTDQSRQQQQNQNRQQNGSNQTGSTAAPQPTSIFRQPTNNSPGNRWNQQLQPVAQDVSPVYNTNIQAPQQQRKQQETKKEDEGAKKRAAANAAADTPSNGIFETIYNNLLGIVPTEQAGAEERDENVTELKGDVEKTGSNDASEKPESQETSENDEQKGEQKEAKKIPMKTLDLDPNNPNEAVLALMGAAGGYGPRPTGPNGKTITPPNFTEPEKNEPTTAPTEELINGLTQEQWDDLTQREQFNQTMFDDDGNLTDFGNAVVNAFGDTYSNRDDAYEQWRLSNNRDLTAALMGLSGEDSPFGGGITGWGDLYAGSGVDRGNNDEEFLNNVMNYMWGDGNAVNLNDVYRLGNDYSNIQGLGWSQDAIEAAAKFGAMLDEMNPFMDYGDTNLNMDDLGTLAVLSLMTQGDNFDVNRLLDPLSEENALTKGGELSKFGFVEDGSDAKEKEISSRKPYDLRMLGGGLDPYTKDGNANNNLVDAHALDTYLDVYNANTKGPKLGLV